MCSSCEDDERGRNSVCGGPNEHSIKTESVSASGFSLRVS